MVKHRLFVLIAVFGPHVVTHGFTSVPARSRCFRDASEKLLTTMTMIGNTRSADRFGASRDSFMIKEFSIYEELEEIVKLAGQPIPERPDGIVCVAKYSSIHRDECQATEAEYERLARDNPATIFLRCMEEYENANLLLSQADIQALPTYDVFYRGNRVARVAGNDMMELEKVLQMYQFQNSELDLFSENAERKRQMKWGDETAKDMNRTPRTTARFVPGYDWNSNKGAFDKQASKVEKDFADTYGNWVPIIDDDDDDDKNKKK